VNDSSIRRFDLDQIRPAPENEQLYHRVTTESVSDLIPSIREHGILEPLVVSEDGFILSGHRRYHAAGIIGLATVPCRVEPIRRDEDRDGFLLLLREANRQRVKTLDEVVREEAISYDPDDCYTALIEARKKLRGRAMRVMELGEERKRARISDAKRPLLEALVRILDGNQGWWPYTVRQLHYNLLNDPPLIHAGKPDSTYRNDLRSYRACVDICLRARFCGAIPWNAIADETRPIITWTTWADPALFVRDQLEKFLSAYWRDLMQSQPAHVELMVEKNTALGPVKEVAARYCIPVTSGRGFASGPPRHALAERFRASGKDRLVVLCLSDFDPPGEEVATSFARTLRDDFAMRRIEAQKVCLTHDQVRNLKLAHSFDQKAKPKSQGYDRFVRQYGPDVYELEALPAETLSSILTKAIDRVIDVDLFNAEVEREKVDSTGLQAVRETVKRLLANVNMGGLQ